MSAQAVERCAQCARALEPPRPGTPVIEAMRDEHGTPMQWCSDECSEAWMDADPKRREGWISVGDLTPERLNEMLGDVGLALEGVGKPSPS